jgi:hypothetical protein
VNISCLEACKKPTLVPLNFRAQVKADIEVDVKKAIPERVPAGRHNTWCSRIVFQEKNNGKTRRTVVLSYLSKQGLHKSHHTLSGHTAFGQLRVCLPSGT